MDKLYVIKSSTGKYIDLDSASGGYPYETDLHLAKFWHEAELDRLIKYVRMFSKEPWEIHELAISSKDARHLLERRKGTT